MSVDNEALLHNAVPEAAVMRGLRNASQPDPCNGCGVSRQRNPHEPKVRRDRQVARWRAVTP